MYWYMCLNSFVLVYLMIVTDGIFYFKNDEIKF